LSRHRQTCEWATDKSSIWQVTVTVCYQYCMRGELEAKWCRKCIAALMMLGERRENIGGERPIDGFVVTCVCKLVFYTRLMHACHNIRFVEVVRPYH